MGIIDIIAFSIIILVFISLLFFIKKNGKINRTDQWKVNDLLLLKEKSDCYKIAKSFSPNKDPYVVLVKWDNKNVMVQLIENENRYHICVDEILKNVSYEQREKNKKMDSYMLKIGQKGKQIDSTYYNDFFGRVKQKENIDYRINKSDSGETVDNFFNEYEITKKNNTYFIKGKALSDLNETELKVYLKLTVDNEKYEISEEIKNILKKKYEE
jgi:hypothetical protein